jgi:hypothetical protein
VGLPSLLRVAVLRREAGRAAARSLPRRGRREAGGDRLGDAAAGDGGRVLALPRRPRRRRTPDFDFYLSYLAEVESLVDEYVPRPATVPDLSLTDYLAGLDTDAKSRLLCELDNHFGLYLYGRQIAAGDKPSRGGGNPFMSGTTGEWAAARYKAVDEAVPQIIERLRPKYGRMYNFDDAQPGNVRLLAMSIQPSLTNR